MSKKPEPSDYIEVEVKDDGECILTKRPNKGSRFVMHLAYGMDGLESLHSELTSYGFTEKAGKKAILKVTFSEYNEEVTVQ
jgi:hypothetical protein